MGSRKLRGGLLKESHRIRLRENAPTRRRAHPQPRRRTCSPGVRWATWDRRAVPCRHPGCKSGCRAGLSWVAARMPPSGEQQNPSVSSPARLPKSKRRASTSASQPPRWVRSASPPRHALWGRESMGGRTPGSSCRLVLVPVLEKFSEPSEKRVSVNPDLKSVCLNPNQKLVPKEKAPICSANYIGKEEEGGSQNHSSIAAHTLAH